MECRLHGAVFEKDWRWWARVRQTSQGSLDVLTLRLSEAVSLRDLQCIIWVTLYPGTYATVDSAIVLEALGGVLTWCCIAPEGGLWTDKAEKSPTWTYQLALQQIGEENTIWSTWFHKPRNYKLKGKPAAIAPKAARAVTLPVNWHTRICEESTLFFSLLGERTCLNEAFRKNGNRLRVR